MSPAPGLTAVKWLSRDINPWRLAQLSMFLPLGLIASNEREIEQCHQCEQNL